MVRKNLGLNRVLWLAALTDQACVIVSIDWRTSATILLVLQANEWVVLLSNRRKEHRKPKEWAKASYNSVLVEGNIDNWFCQTICFALDAKYTKKIITASRHHLKPIQGGTENSLCGTWHCKCKKCTVHFWAVQLQNFSSSKLFTYTVCLRI